jgi:microcystin-dependent protein
MAEKISITKGFDNDTFDTYVPDLTDSADIQNAFELFYYGNSENGNAEGDVSLHKNIVDFDNRITLASSELSGHAGTSLNVHGVGVGNSVVGTGTSQTLTNKTLTSPTVSSPTISNPTFTISSAIAGPNLVPVGSIVMFGGSAAPIGWLLCNGQSTSGYTALAAVVGATVPDLMGRTPIGYGDSADSGITTRSTIGAKTGTETHTLIESEMPAHTHNINPAMIVGGGSGAINNYAPNGNNPTSSVTITSTGGGGAHNNMQPSTVVNFIIKY